MIDQLKHIPKTNKELTCETIEKIQDAYDHMACFFKTLGGAPDRTIVYVLVNEIFSYYKLMAEQKPRLYEIITYAVFSGGEE